jgi:hypothetical protein
VRVLNEEAPPVSDKAETPRLHTVCDEALAMNIWPGRSQIFPIRRGSIFKARPAIFILIVLAAFGTSFFHRFRNNMIFACEVSGYTSDRYLSYCGATEYGDYEHGAFWFDLEPAAEWFAAKAEVLFLGNSRTQYGFSTTATAQWFSSASASYYLLSFGLWENSIFEGALLRKLKPRAKVYIINVVDFFQPFEAPLAQVIMHDPAERSRSLSKRYLQFVHKAICMKLPSICGRITPTYRSRQTGMSYVQELSTFKGQERPVSYDQRIDKREIDDGIAIGRIFLSDLPAEPECVILTAVPYARTKLAVAKAIASGLGKMLVSPDLDWLQTFDGNHLDPASAERWSEAFFKAAGPQIQKCVAEPRAPSS